MTSFVRIAGVDLPAEEVATAFQTYVFTRLDADKRKRYGEPAFYSKPWSDAMHRLRSGIVASDENGSGCLPALALQPLNEWAAIHQIPPTTARGWAQTGRIWASQSAGRWYVHPGEQPPRKRAS